MFNVPAEIEARADVVNRVRVEMRDYPELNTLIDGEESSDAFIEYAMDVVMEEINATPPPVGLFLVQNTPLHLLIDGTVARLLRSLAILYLRNDVDFGVDGLTVRYNQGQTYLAVAQERAREFESKLLRWKVSVNAQQAVDGSGGIYSDWVAVNRPTRFFYNDAIRGINELGSP